MHAHPLSLALICMLLCVILSILLLAIRHITFLGHMTGIISSIGFAIAGFTGMFHKVEYRLIGHGVLTFTTLSFRMNAIAAFFVLLIGVIGLFVSVYTIGYVREYRGRKPAPLFIAGVLAFQMSMVAVVLAANVFTFLVSWECMSVISFLLVMFEHEELGVRSAGYIYVVMTHIGSAFIAISFFILGHYSNSFTFATMNPQSIPNGMKTLIFLLALVGFGTKAGLVPVHIWLPRAHPVAPSNVSALMSGVMIKIAVYGFLLVVFQCLSGWPVWWGVVVTLMGALTALLGILHALGQTDYKRFLAFSSIENMGIIFLGLGMSLTLDSLHHPLLAAFALLAALVHAFNHALFKSLLFLGAGAILSSTHTKNMNKLGGLIRSMPWTAAFTLVGALSISAMPPFNGFTQEWMLFQSAFGLATQANKTWPIVIAVSIIGVLTMTAALVAMAFVRSFGTTFLALPRTEYAKTAHEVSVSMRVGMAGLAILCLVSGIFSSWVISIFKSPVQQIAKIQLKGTPTFSLQTFGSEPERLSVLSVIAVAAAVFAVLWLAVRLWTKRTVTIREETWACGGSLTPRMTYTASGYSKPIRVAFEPIIQPSRTINLTQGSPFFPTKFVYKSQVNSFAETKLYRPVVNLVIRAAHLIRRIQNGQVQSYLAYLFVTLIVVLLLVK